MADAQGHPMTAHTTNLVPLVLIDPKRKQAKLHDGALCDLAPKMCIRDRLWGLHQRYMKAERDT